MADDAGRKRSNDWNEGFAGGGESELSSKGRGRGEVECGNHNMVGTEPGREEEKKDPYERKVCNASMS